MEFLFAPMEGITFALYRRIHHSLFPGMTEYYTPFIAPDSQGSFKPKFLRELTSDGEEYRVVPQLLVNNAASFTLTAEKLVDLGFTEINLNVGCPSGTVYSKYKGAGMLRDLNRLDGILEQIFSHAEQDGYQVSIKTRMGIHSTTEFSAVLDIYRKYPLAKLIIHARCRDDYYKGKPDIEAFREAVKQILCPVVYNGNVFSREALNDRCETTPGISSVMLGRGVVANPALCRWLAGGEQLELQELKRFHDELVRCWITDGLSPTFTMERMKTLWIYIQTMFPRNGKERKQILKAKRLEEYQYAVEVLFETALFEPEQICQTNAGEALTTAR